MGTSGRRRNSSFQGRWVDVSLRINPRAILRIKEGHDLRLRFAKSSGSGRKQNLSGNEKPATCASSCAPSPRDVTWLSCWRKKYGAPSQAAGWKAPLRFYCGGLPCTRGDHRLPIVQTIPAKPSLGLMPHELQRAQRSRLLRSSLCLEDPRPLQKEPALPISSQGQGPVVQFVAWTILCRLYGLEGPG